MSTRLMLGLVLLLIVGIAIGALGFMWVQSAHLFTPALPQMHEHSHW